MSLFGNTYGTTIQILHNAAAADAAGAPAADWQVAFADVPADVQDHRSKLHGGQSVEYDQPVTEGSHDIYVAGLYPELGGQGNGYAVMFDGTTFARITNIERFRQGFEGVEDYCLLICDEVSS